MHFKSTSTSIRTEKEVGHDYEAFVQMEFEFGGIALSMLFADTLICLSKIEDDGCLSLCCIRIGVNHHRN